MSDIKIKQDKIADKIKELEVQRQMVVDEANASVHQIDGAIIILKSIADGTFDPEDAKDSS